MMLSKSACRPACLAVFTTTSKTDGLAADKVLVKVESK